MTRRRVVVTGLGCISPVGNSVKDAWANVLAGNSGIDLITRFDATNFACKIAGEVKGFDLELALAPEMVKRIRIDARAYRQTLQMSAWSRLGTLLTRVFKRSP